MTSNCRRELLDITRDQYQSASRAQKGAILDGFTKATGYNRKYAIGLLTDTSLKVVRARHRQSVYGTDVTTALIAVWLACNRIAAKRLVPVIPTMLAKMEKYGHIQLEEQTREKLLTVSAATADRLLRAERKKYGRSKSTTRPGRFLKSQVALKTFSEWDNATPGFLEADLVSHCGGVPKGLHLYTLTMTDIATGWTELWPVLGKTDDAVLAGIAAVYKALPFPLQGIDTDNGTEFINYALGEWCEQRSLTFTRSREYRKNDQAHVEEKNGSIVRRYVGYDRFEGESSTAKLLALYQAVRLYVNFFQPSMKLLHKEREGGKVRKQYDCARTPHERLQQSSIAKAVKLKLQRQFDKLDPVALLCQIENLQMELWATAVHASPATISADSFAYVLGKVVGENSMPEVLVRARNYRAGLRDRLLVRLADSAKPDDSSGGRGQTARMRKRVREWPLQKALGLSDLTELGTRGCANQLLEQLVQQKQLVKIGRGKYAKPGYAPPPPQLFESTGSQAKDMRIFIFNLKPSETFCRQDLRRFGSVGSVSQLMKMLLKQGVIVRVAHDKYTRAK